MPTSISSLPPELLSTILSHLSPDGLSPWNLLSTSLVSHSFRLPSQQALNDTIVFEDVDRARAWLDSPKRTDFTTRYLVLDSETDWFEEVEKELVGASPHIAHLTLMYPNHFFTDVGTPLPHALTSLTLHKSGYVPIPLLSLLLSSSTSSLLSLHIGQFSNEQISPPPLVTFFASTSHPNTMSVDAGGVPSADLIRPIFAAVAYTVERWGDVEYLTGRNTACIATLTGAICVCTLLVQGFLIRRTSLFIKNVWIIVILSIISVGTFCAAIGCAISSAVRAWVVCTAASDTIISGTLVGAIVHIRNKTNRFNQSQLALPLRKLIRHSVETAIR
ncbi:hypothetical protein RQP46_002485 [Phenoliferia psychrophenolica]